MSGLRMRFVRLPLADAAPEQYSGGTTPRSDIYSLGATCYVLLTGQVPPHALRRAISKDGDLLQPAHELVPAIPEEVAYSIERAMAIHSEDRFETVAQFWKELSSQSSEHPGEAGAPELAGCPTTST